jgi:hypothetical protein
MAKARKQVAGVCPRCGAPHDWRSRLTAGGRKPLAKLWPKAVAMAKRLRRRRLSYREISAQLADAGHLNERGQPFNPQSVRAMIEGPQRR